MEGTEGFTEDERFMALALEQAREAAGAGEVPVGAVLVSGAGIVLALGRNRSVERHDPTAHAEVNVLRAAGDLTGNYRLTDSVIYVTIEPCVMCAGALVHARVRRLVFGAPDPKAGACGSVFDIVRDTRLNHSVEVTGGVLEAQCRGVIQEFFQARRCRRE